MSLPLLIPWFKLHAWPVPIPFVGSIDIQPFGILVAIGILLGSRVAEWHGERNGVPRQAVADFLVVTIVTGLISAYFLNAVFYKPEDIVAIIKDPSQFTKKYLGLSSYGGFIGGVAAAFWFRQRRGMSIMVLGDIWCFAFPFAWLFGRTGCFVVHDHPGKASDFFLAVDDYNGQGIPRHDLGLYEVIWSAATIALFLWLGQKRRPRGFFMGLLPILYAPIRFFLDYLRVTPELGGDVRYGSLTPAQYASILFTVVGAAVLYRVYNRPEATLMLDGSDPPGFGPSQRSNDGAIDDHSATAPTAAGASSGSRAGGSTTSVKKKKKKKR